MDKKSETKSGNPGVYWIRVDLGAKGKSKRSSAQIARNIVQDVKRNPLVEAAQMISDEKMMSLIGHAIWSAFQDGRKDR